MQRPCVPQGTREAGTPAKTTLFAGRLGWQRASTPRKSPQAFFADESACFAAEGTQSRIRMVGMPAQPAHRPRAHPCQPINQAWGACFHFHLGEQALQTHPAHGEEVDVREGKLSHLRARGCARTVAPPPGPLGRPCASHWRGRLGISPLAPPSISPAAQTAGCARPASRTRPPRSSGPGGRSSGASRASRQSS